MMGGRYHIVLLRIAMTVGVVVGSLMLLSAVKTKDSKPCSKITVVYRNGNESGFFPKADVIKSIKSIIQMEPVGAALEHFKLKEIEQKLEAQPWVYDAQMYFDNNQALHVVIDEAIPVARVIDTEGNHFYLDKIGNELPLSPSYRADLPVFTGLSAKRNNDVSRAGIKRIIGLAQVIVADSFWLSQAAQIDLAPTGKMELVPVFGNHIVELGYATQPAAMMAKLKQFYLAIAAAGKLNDYVKLNATFERQIVAQRDSFRVQGADKMQAMDTYRRIISENKKVVNANSIVTEDAAGRIIRDAPATPEKNNDAQSNQVEVKRVIQVEKIMPANKPEPVQTEKSTEIKEQKMPKAIMPKLENN